MGNLLYCGVTSPNFAGRIRIHNLFSSFLSFFVPLMCLGENGMVF
jgi:hypothetical protein